MTTTKAVKRALVSLSLPISVPAFISMARAVVQAMTNNPSFPSPDPNLATVTTAIDALQTAEGAAQARTKGAVASRNEKRKALVTLLEQLKAYIQKVADGNPDTAAAVIQSAGVGIRKTVPRQKQAFLVTAGAVAGTVRVTAQAAARRASYEWEYSLDGGKTWQAMPATLQARTQITGLAQGATVSVRYKAVTKAGEGDWSQATSYFVH